MELGPKTGLFYGLRRVTPSRELVRRCAGAQRPRRQRRGGRRSEGAGWSSDNDTGEL